MDLSRQIFKREWNRVRDNMSWHNNRLETDLRPARRARWSRPFSLIR